ncbi:hypothetical protein RF55_13810 [Lasius niger]|uniref:Uncharacterized protein n=1 Tax=Lasius niger TaxID=67767 RepID=A0A0J7K9L7_LASNI|nr:hypothetical protein RF55_13810 [Lasius niger]
MTAMLSDTESCSDDADDEDKNNKCEEPPNKSNTSLEINKSAEVPAAGTFDDKDLYIENSSKCSKDKKRNCCLFCKKLYTKIARHLETIHSNEDEVKKFSLLLKKCTERLKIIDTIRRKGNFQYNTDKNVGKGDLIVCRRPQASKNKEAKDYLPCAKCHGFFSKISLRQHFYRCTGRSSKHAKAVTILGRAILGRVHSAANKKLRSVILPVIREDDVYRVIKYDKLIILYGNKLSIKYKLQHQHDMIRAHLRLLGRFLLTIKESNKNIIDFESIYHPKFYEDVISTVNKVAGLDDEVGIYSKPTTAAMLGTLIKKVGHVLITECIKRQDDEKKALVKDFFELLTEDYGTSVNKTVMETRLQHERQKSDDLPSLDDISKLYMYLKCKRQKAFEDLTNEYTYETWLTLAECTLTSVQLFNRKRAGEIERILIVDFEQYRGIDPDTANDLFKIISLKAQEAAKKYVRFVIRGKLGRTVPVILNYNLLECVKLILHFREKAKVPAENPYIFGLPSYNRKRFKYLRACVLMRKFSEDCNAKVAHLLRGTKLRKHIATFCASMELADTEISDLANFMGHAEKIHREVYRQPIISRDILNITQHLEAAHGCNSQNTEESSTDEDSSNDEADIRKENIGTAISEGTNY